MFMYSRKCCGELNFLLFYEKNEKMQKKIAFQPSDTNIYIVSCVKVAIVHKSNFKRNSFTKISFMYVENCSLDEVVKKSLVHQYND